MAYRPLTDALLDSIGMYQRHKARPGILAMLLRRAARILHAVLSTLTGSDIDVGFRFGRNLLLPHPTGVVVHRSVVIGDDCMVMQQVTLGQVADGGVPVIGSRVYIGAGAKVLGPIRIGDDARIGANAVVLTDVPAGATAVGVPAKVLLSERSQASGQEPPTVG
jgi:serine O-acetyltransferase